MINTNGRIDEQLVNGTTCGVLYIKHKPGCKFTKENWEMYVVNTICDCDKVNINNTHPECVEVKPEESLCSIILMQLSNMPIERISMAFLPVNNVSTTGNKLDRGYLPIRDKSMVLLMPNLGLCYTIKSESGEGHYNKRKTKQVKYIVNE